MKLRIRVILTLVLALLLSGCQKRAEPVQPEMTEPTEIYDWMAGESPVPNLRTGYYRQGVTNSAVAIGRTGIYTISSPAPCDDSYILYADNDSDTFLKLCGRADCTHNTSDCNAYVYAGSDVSFYNGQLYIMSGEGFPKEETKLIRMDPDGSNRVVVLDVLQFGKENGGEFVFCDMITEGYCLFSTYYWKETEGKDQLVMERLQTYIYKLDGSGGGPKVPESDVGALYNCGDVLLSLDNGCYYDWDLETDTATFLTETFGIPGWYGPDSAYYFKDGAIHRLTYETQKDEIMADTGLEGDYIIRCFPDCIVVLSRGSKETDCNLYVYNWAFELVDAVKLEFPYNEDVQNLLTSENAERFILTDEFKGMPKYYIEKSELGTGNAKVYQYDLSAVG